MRHPGAVAHDLDRPADRPGDPRIADRRQPPHEGIASGEERGARHIRRRADLIDRLRPSQRREQRRVIKRHGGFSGQTRFTLHTSMRIADEASAVPPPAGRPVDPDRARAGSS